jgi:cell cycle sensor histidine kinase DivJ
VLSLIGDHLDALLHPSARNDALTRARHRAFMAPRLCGSLVALGTFPVYLAMRGAPGALEVAAFGWLMTPILLSYFLSRTGRFEGAHVLSSLALAALVMLVALNTGGIGSFAAIWLVLIPLEAALSGSRRVVGFAALLTVAAALALIALNGHGLSAPAAFDAATQAALMGFGVISAALYAAGLAFGAQVMTRMGRALLSQEEERYRLLACHMSDVMVRHRRDGAVEFVSPAAESLLGVAPADLAGQRLFERVHVADRPAYLTALSNAARGSDEASVEFRIRRDRVGEAAARHRAAPDFIWIEMRCRALAGTSGQATSGQGTTRQGTTRQGATEVVSVLRDITGRKRQAEALEAARAEAERAGAAKARFLATMSHELRTPLNAIIGFSEMMTQEATLPLDAARRHEYARLINESGRHLLSVVNDILDLSRLESGHAEFAPEPFAPRPALLHCCDLLALKARDRGIDLSALAPEDLPQVTGDPRAFKQIVINLVSNAIKFTERGGEVRVSASADRAALTLRVSDTGIGIAPDDLKRIGDPFFQAATPYQRRHEGTGLGLSIVKSLVAMHGGEIGIDSKLGEGTRISVVLPLRAATGAAGKVRDNVATLVPAAPAVAIDDRVKLSA